MQVLIDTNVLRADIGARSSRFAVLCDYLQRTRAQLLIPRIVFDEFLGVYSRELSDRLAKQASANASVADFLPRVKSPPREVRDMDATVAEYSAHFLTRLGIHEQSSGMPVLRVFANAVHGYHVRRPRGPLSGGRA